MRHVLLATAAALVCAAASIGVIADDPFRVGFVYDGIVEDHGWSSQHSKGRLVVEDAFGDKVQTTFIELMSDGPDTEQIIRQLAADGHQLVFPTFGNVESTIQVAKEFPDIYFEHCSGYGCSDNVVPDFARFYEGRYLIGRIAGAVTQSNTIGYIASYPTPEVVRGINSFTLGLRNVNPDATVKVVWISNWFDPDLESDTAKELIDQGADIIVQHTNSSVPLQIAEECGAWAYGQTSDMAAFGPRAHLTAIVNNWGPYYVARTQAAMNGSWRSGDIWSGIGST